MRNQDLVGRIAIVKHQNGSIFYKGDILRCFRNDSAAVFENKYGAKCVVDLKNISLIGHAYSPKIGSRVVKNPFSEKDRLSLIPDHCVGIVQTEVSNMGYVRVDWDNFTGSYYDWRKDFLKLTDFQLEIFKAANNSRPNVAGTTAAIMDMTDSQSFADGKQVSEERDKIGFELMEKKYGEQNVVWSDGNKKEQKQDWMNKTQREEVERVALAMKRFRPCL